MIARFKNQLLIWSRKNIYVAIHVGGVVHIISSLIPERGLPITINEPSSESSENHHKRGTVVKSDFSPIDDLLDRGVDRQIGEDWLALRKNKKAAVTRTALNGVAKQADIAGILLEDVLKICCERGWAGFNAEWILQRRTSAAVPIKQSRHSGFEKTDYSDGVTTSGYLS